jgi:hypothetical protein
VAATTARSITDRMLGALRLDVETYEEIEADQKATGEAAFVVVASSIVAAAGYALMRGGTVDAGFIGAIAELIAWAIYAWLAYLIGTKLIPGKATRSTWGEVARTLGYATTPRFALLFVGIPGLSGFVRIAVSIWILVATVVALRSALDCGTVRAIVVAVIASFAQAIVATFILGLLG